MSDEEAVVRALSAEVIDTIAALSADSAIEHAIEQEEREREERRLARQRRDQVRIGLALKNFPSAPDLARIAPDVVDALIGRSTVTGWRLIRKGRLPQPGADGCVAVGALRAALAALGQS